ncbi:hypothetical protein ACLMJK_009244 [Lecanora helva]
MAMLSRDEKGPLESPRAADEKLVDDVHHEDTAEGCSNEQVDIDPILDRRITRKFDTHIVPWLFGIWLLAFIDRSNIGNARIDGLAKDLKLTGDKYNVALTVFYVPYILIDVPSNWFLKYVGAGYYLPGLLLGWGIVGTCMGSVKTYGGLIATRFFLGLCEGGLLGGMVLYLSMFYIRKDLLFRLGLFYCAAPLSGAFGGLLATGLAEIRFHGYNRWPWIFFVEGTITVLFGLLVVFFLPHTPMQAKCLTEEERVTAVARMKLDAQGATTASSVDRESFSWSWVRMALLNINTAVLSLNFFAIITPIYSFSLFLPTIISDLGYSSVIAQLFTVPPNIAGFIFVIVGAYLSDKIKARGPVMIAGCSLAIIGYIMLLVPANPHVHYAGTFFVAAADDGIEAFSQAHQRSWAGLILRKACQQSCTSLCEGDGYGIPDSDSELLCFHRDLHLPAGRCSTLHHGTLHQPGIFGNVDIAINNEHDLCQMGER